MALGRGKKNETEGEINLRDEGERFLMRKKYEENVRMIVMTVCVCGGDNNRVIRIKCFLHLHVSVDCSFLLTIDVLVPDSVLV